MRRLSLRIYKLLAVTLLVSLASPQTSSATWKPLLKKPFKRGVRCAFFLNEQTGFVGITGDIGIYRTNDGGTTWIKCNTPAGYAGNFTSIFMTDTLRGWATIEEPANSSNVFISQLFRTTDGGLNWIEVGPTGFASCVYETSHSITVTSRLLSGSGMTSTNGGQAFTTGVLKLTNGVDFVDDLHGVATGFQANPWLRTQDGGATWQPIAPLMNEESWGVYGMKGTHIFVTGGERDPNNLAIKSSIVFVSTDDGMNWQSPATLTVRTTGHIAGAANAIYVQTTNNSAENPAQQGGMLRSTNLGVTWIPVGGPINDNDTRFFVLGCKGGIVYAFDGSGQIWKTRDGGDGTIVEPPLIPQFSPTSLTLTSPICSTGLGTITFANLHCSDLQILSVGFVDSSETIVQNGSLRFTGLPALPRMYATNEGDSIRLVWDPGKAFHHDTTITTRIHVRFFSVALGRTVDTIIVVNAHAAGVAPEYQIAPSAIAIDTVHPCVTTDSLISIFNAGCDTLFVTGADSATQKGIVLLDSSGSPTAFPYAIPPMGTIRLRLRASIHMAGVFNSSIRLHLEHQGISQDTTVRLTTTVPFENAFVVPSAVALDTATTCRALDSLIAVTNPGCDTLTITSLKLLKGIDFKLVGAGILPIKIPPGGSWTFDLNFAPITVGSLLDSLIVGVSALGETVRLSLPVSGVGSTGHSAFVTSLATPSLAFPTLTRCDAPDSMVFEIRNPGCQRMTVHSVALQGALAPVVTVTTTPQLPFAMTDGDIVRVVVRCSPSARGNYAGMLHLVYNFTGQPTVDSALSVAASIEHGMRILSFDTSQRDLGSVLFCSTKDTTIIYRNTGCDSTEVTLRTVAGSGFMLLNPKTVPFNLGPGASDTLRLRYIPTQAGIALGQVSIASDADSNASGLVNLSASVPPTDTLLLRVTAPAGVRGGDTTLLSVWSNHSVTKKGLKSLHFLFSYNGDLLTPVGFQNHIPQSTVQFGPQVRSAFKTAYLPITIQSNVGNLTVDSTSPLIDVMMRATISDSSHTDLGFSDLTLNGGDANFERCTLGASSTPGAIQLALMCGDSTLQNYLRFGSKMPLSAEPVNPDPFVVATNSQLTLRYFTTLTGSVRLTIFDQRGTLVSSHLREDESAGAHMFEIDARPLDAGTYHYQLVTAEDGFALGKFVVLR